MTSEGSEIYWHRDGTIPWCGIAYQRACAVGQQVQYVVLLQLVQQQCKGVGGIPKHCSASVERDRKEITPKAPRMRYHVMINNNSSNTCSRCSSQLGTPCSGQQCGLNAALVLDPGLRFYLEER